MKLLKAILMVSLLALPLQSPRANLLDKGQDPSAKIAAQIVKNNPKIDAAYANRLARIIFSKTSAYNVSPRIMTAIIMQESAYRPNAKQCYQIGEKLHCDYCMVQINDITIKRYGFDQHRLMSDLPYCVEAGVRVLSDFKKSYSKHDVNYWTRFNASDPLKRIAYRDAVNRYF